MLDRIKKEIKWWSFAAKTLPFAALAMLISLHYFSYVSWYSILTITIIVVFFSVSVFWWWWALDRIFQIIKILKETEKNFLSVKEDITDTKNILYEESNNNQEWREQHSK